MALSISKYLQEDHAVGGRLPPQRSALLAGGASSALMQGSSLPLIRCTAAGTLRRRRLVSAMRSSELGCHVLQFPFSCPERMAHCM